jgi:hypothetical protein
VGVVVDIALPVLVEAVLVVMGQQTRRELTQPQVPQTLVAVAVALVVLGRLGQVALVWLFCVTQLLSHPRLVVA